MEMKKYLLPLIGLLFTVSAQAASFTDGKEYITLEKPVASAPAALKFFSFYFSNVMGIISFLMACEVINTYRK